MTEDTSADATVVGSGPNGLAAAIMLARSGRSVTVLEAAETAGGGARSAALTLPGFVHDICSAVHPLGAASPAFRQFGLGAHGLEWIYPPTELAHPFDDGTAATLERSVVETAAGLGPDERAYRRLVEPLLDNFSALLPQLLAPPLRLPRHPAAAARFGVLGLASASRVARRRFEGERARALFAGMAAHSILPLESRPSAAVGLVLALTGHAFGWPIPRGGSGEITAALVRCLEAEGGRVVVDRRVTSLRELPSSTTTLLDLSPTSAVEIGGDRFPASYRRRLARFRHGPGVFKLDLALDGPIPWTAEGARRSGTLHLGGTLDEIAAGEGDVWRGRHPERPFVLLAQPSQFDPSRAPEGCQAVWAYCHVPRGSTVNMTDRIEAQIERFAPGFRDRILARHAMGPAELEQRNANYVGGDISGGVQDLRQLFARPVLSIDPYATPDRRVYLCSASTPPGAGVHGMCGFHAAHSALRRAPW